MNIAVIGGGINGLCVAWLALQQGHEVTLFERGQLMSETSSKSSRMLHGGLRYLENLEFRLVREALHERQFWLEQVPELTRPLRVHLPVYTDSRRPAWKVRLGLWLYDLLAGDAKPGKYRQENSAAVLKAQPGLRQQGLKAVFSYMDGQMDDYRLGLWVADQVRHQGGVIREHSRVVRVSADGRLWLEDGDAKSFDRIVNVAGPWAEQLLQDSDIGSDTRLDLIRGSHLLLEGETPHAWILEAPGERRVFFVLPSQGKTLLGTTEVRQTLDESIEISDQERDYLLKAYQHYFPRQPVQLADSFAGVRPLLKSHGDPNKVSREYVIERKQRLVSVFGGKWTTSRALAESVLKQLD